MSSPFVRRLLVLLLLLLLLLLLERLLYQWWRLPHLHHRRQQHHHHHQHRPHPLVLVEVRHPEDHFARQCNNSRLKVTDVTEAKKNRYRVSLCYRPKLYPFPTGHLVPSPSADEISNINDCFQTPRWLAIKWGEGRDHLNHSTGCCRYRRRSCDDVCGMGTNATCFSHVGKKFM
jgi:hypothetical protein